MKRKVIFTCTLCFLLCVCGCTPRTAGEIRRTDEESQADANAALPKSKDQFEYWLGALPFYNNVKAEGIGL